MREECREEKVEEEREKKEKRDSKRTQLRGLFQKISKMRLPTPFALCRPTVKAN